MIKELRKLIKCTMCNHGDIEFVRNIYGDEALLISQINKMYGSEFKCRNCGEIVYTEHLIPNRHEPFQPDGN